MGDPERVILDISSDEEVGCGENKGSDDYGWINELLDGAGSENSEEVVVVREVIMNPKQNFKSLTTKSNDDDDDCIVLEEDPDKPVEVDNDKSDNDDDDLLVVSEKGQIACRDYPHPRHLCAKFPFGSTPHERHCDQCHCYVCDTLAPCVYWHNGAPTVAHCNATDKDTYWKAQRRSTKKSDTAFPLVRTGPDTSVSVSPHVANQAPGLTRRLPNHPSQNQTFRQAPIRPCSMSSSPGLPNTGQQLTALRDKFHNHVVSQQLRNTSINVIPRDKSHNFGHMRPQCFTTRTAFKRAGSSGQSLATGRSAYNSSNTASVPQIGRTHSSLARWQESCGRVPVGSNKYIASSQPNAGMCGANSVSCLSQLHRQHGLVGVPANYTPMGPEIAFQTNAGIVGANTVSSQHQVPAQPTLRGVSANYASMGPEMPSQLSADTLGANAVSFQRQSPMQPNIVGLSANYGPMEPAMPSQPSFGALGASAVSFQPELPRQPSHVGVSANYAPMEHQIPSQPQVSVCATASSEVPAFSEPYANSSSSQPHLSALPSILNDFESFLSSENAVLSQTRLNIFNDPLVSEAEIFSQLNADAKSANSFPQQTSVAFHPEGGKTSVNVTASQYPLACPANASTSFGNSTTSVSQSSNQPDGGFRPELLTRHLSSSSDSQNVSQHGHQSENALAPNIEDFDLSVWYTDVSPSNSPGHVYNPKPKDSPEVSRHSQSIDSPTNLDLQSWLVSEPLNILSPEAPPIDSGFFVDF